MGGRLGVLLAQLFDPDACHIQAVILEVVHDGFVQIGHRGTLGAGRGDDLGGVAARYALKPAAQALAVVDDVVHRLEEYRVAAVDHFVARRTGHPHHRVNKHMHGVQFFRRQHQSQLIQLGLDAQLLGHQLRRCTVGVGDRRLGHRDIIQRQNVRIIVQSSGLGHLQGGGLFAQALAAQLGDLVQLLVGHLLIDRLNGDRDGNDALAVFFIHGIVEQDVRLAVDLAFGFVQHGAAHVGPVGRVAVHLFFQRLDAPHERFAFFLFLEVKILVTLAQLVNFDAVLALHRQCVGDVHCRVELFELDQVRLQRLVERQHDLAGALVDGGAA